MLRRQEAEKEAKLKEEEERDKMEEEKRIAAEEEEDNERRLEAAATKVMERQRRLEGGKVVSMEEEECKMIISKKEEEETMESVRRKMAVVLVEGEAEMPDTVAVADIVAAEFVKQRDLSPSFCHQTECDSTRDCEVNESLLGQNSADDENKTLENVSTSKDDFGNEDLPHSNVTRDQEKLLERYLKGRRLP